MRFQAGFAGLCLIASGCASAPAPAAPAATAAPAVAAELPLVTESRAIVQAYVDKTQFSGAVLVAKDGKAVFREGFGLANRELDVPNTPETVFRLASITKQFTAASILQLAEQGKLSLDDPGAKYYPAAPAAWSKVTIRQLLSHRSGIGDYTDLPDFFEKLAAVDRTPEEILAMTHDRPLAFEPGAKFAYNNSGYVWLGAIIEKVSGQKYADYVQAHIFAPLGMKHSGYDNSLTLLPRRADGYSARGGVWANTTYLSMTLPYAAGSLYSTVDDLLIWEDALFSDKVVSAASRQAMMTDNGEKYGFGLIVDALGNHRNIWHNGGINGFSTHMSRFVDDGLTVIVLSNLESARSDKVANELAGLWLGLPPPAKLVAVPVPAAVLDRYVGVYQLTPAMNVTITRDGDQLMAQATGQGAFPLLATSETEFHYQPSDLRMTFPAGEGPAPEFTMFQSVEMKATRIAPPPASN